MCCKPGAPQRSVALPSSSIITFSTRFVALSAPRADAFVPGWVELGCRLLQIT